LRVGKCIRRSILQRGLGLRVVWWLRMGDKLRVRLRRAFFVYNPSRRRCILGLNRALLGHHALHFCVVRLGVCEWVLWLMLHMCGLGMSVVGL